MSAADLRARYDAAVAATVKARDAYREAKAERILVCKGERDGCRTLAWAKDDAARAAYEEASMAQSDLSYELGDA